MAEKKKTADAKAPKAKAAKETKTAKPVKAAEPKAPKPAKKAKKEAAPAATSAPQELGAWSILNTENKAIGQIALSPEVFGVRVNDHLLYEAVKQYRAGGRRGTHMTKNRALVAGSGKKPWRQKGTGRARIGSVRNPLWRHGGTVFGPQPRDYSYTMPRKARAAALRSALSQRAKDGALKIVDGFAIETPKTKVLKAILDTLGVAGKAVLVDHEPSDALILSGRNIPGLKVVDSSHVTVYDVLDCTTLIVSQDAVGKLEERLTP